MNILTISDSISKAYRQVPIAKDDIVNFRTALRTLYGNIRAQSHEDNQETYLRDFLRSSFYARCDINKPDESDIDWAVRMGDSNTPVGIIIENKTLRNKQEMVTTDDLDRKAMQELVYYYMEERIERENVNVRHLIANNMYEFFVFDSQEFEKYFYQNKDLVRDFKAFKRGELPFKDTGNFYTKIASKYIKLVQDKITFTYFDLQSYKSAIMSDDEVYLNRLIPLYRIFNNIYLMKLPFQNDNNSLNEMFYRELLHILGLKEERIDNKIRIVRKVKGERNKASLLENAINKLDAEDALHNLDAPAVYGCCQDEQYFNVALQLCITWINRILFLKLLEAQLVKYNHGNKEYRFLTKEKIGDFDELNRLFFQVLARKYNERGEDEQRDFADVPYLNSSLFEVSDLERKTIKVSGLSQKERLPVLPNSILKKDEHLKSKDDLPTLEYLFAFLDAYNFAYESEDEIQETPKTLISASVLGLIFEKINGHKDGAIYTPGYVTMYMSREAIRRTVIQRFNDRFHWKCKTLTDVRNNEPDISEANRLINNLKICDPAVGSGHFLVSALNELLQIKYDLGILEDDIGERILKTDYTFTIENDELVVTDARNNLFVYNKDNKESRRVQETLFNEKRKLIENCLFGVDLNPNSVNICRLRLWIELLKHSYYTVESNYKHLETLPNIDINIKCGNSLLMQNALDYEIKQVLAGTTFTITQYQNDVRAYKHTSDKEAKRKLEKDIAIIKATIRHKLSEESPVYKSWSIAAKKLQEYQEQSQLFGANDKVKERIAKTENDVVKYRRMLDDYLDAPVFQDAFEWRYEFPEILNTSGKFVGFDCIIGNPPYGVSIKGEYRKGVCIMWKQVPDYEIYYYFIQLAAALLKDKGYLSYIIPNTWLFNTFAKNYRQKLLSKWDIKELLDCTRFNIFESVTVRNSIITMQRTDEGCNYIGYRNTAQAEKFEELIAEPLQTIAREDLLVMNQNWALAFSRQPEVISLVNKIAFCNNSLLSYFETSQGYIPYRKSDLIKEYGEEKGNRIVNERLWHSPYPVDNTYIQEIYGRDITKYSYHSSGEYVKYGKHLACYVDLKFFNSQRLLVREITNPQIIACYIEELYVNDPQLISVIPKKKDSLWSLQLLWAIFNSKLATFYHFNHSPKATKGAFPKILVQDVQQFPLPAIQKEDAETIEKFVNDVLQNKRANPFADTYSLESDIDRLVYHLYGLSYDEVLIIDPTPPFTQEEYEQGV